MVIQLRDSGLMPSRHILRYRVLRWMSISDPQTCVEKVTQV